MSKPPALTADGLATLFHRVKLLRAQDEPTVTLPIEAAERLIAMAERSVSEETLRKLARHFEVADATELDDDHDDDGETWYEFTESACDDLAAAATRLRQGGEGNG